jgi:hypothetical protein
MSWSPVDCYPLRRPRNPEPHSIPSLRTSTSRNPSVRRDVELGSDTTDVASTSCPLSRTSSATQSIDRGQHTLDLQGASRYSYAPYEFTTSCCFRVVCLRLSAFLPYIAALSAEIARTHRLHTLHSSNATPLLHPTSDQGLSAPGSSVYDSDSMYVGDGTWDSQRNTFLLPNLQGLNFETMRYNGKIDGSLD